jgi:uncharacterized protein YjdB
MKKTISLFLTVIMVLSVMAVAGTASAVGIAKVNGVECKVGATVTYTYELKAPGVAEDFQGRINYTSGLRLDEVKLSETEGSVITNDKISGVFYYNGTSTNYAYDFSAGKTFITAKFTLTDIGEQTIQNTLEILTGKDEMYKDYDENINLCTENETVIADVINVESVKLNKSATTIMAGRTEVLTATVSPNYATNTDIVWTSSDESVATVSANNDTQATVTAVTPGKAEITAQSGDMKAVCTVTVDALVESVTVSPSSATVTVGKTVALKASVSPSYASVKDVSWTTSDDSIATVDENGVVKGIKAGTVTITATSKDGAKKSASATIKVVKPVVKVTKVSITAKTKVVAKGKSITLKATVSPTNATNKKVKWTTSNSKVATVSSTGKVTAKSKGTAVITATATDGSSKRASVTIKVTQPVTKVVIKKGNKKVTSLNLKRKATVQLKASVTPSNASNKKVSWSSAKKSIVSVSSTGKVKVAKNAKIGKKVAITAKAKDGSKKSAKCTIKVVK